MKRAGAPEGAQEGRLEGGAVDSAAENEVRRAVEAQRRVAENERRRAVEEQRPGAEIDVRRAVEAQRRVDGAEVEVRAARRRAVEAQRRVDGAEVEVRAAESADVQAAAGLRSPDTDRILNATMKLAQAEAEAKLELAHAELDGCFERLRYAPMSVPQMVREIVGLGAMSAAYERAWLSTTPEESEVSVKTLMGKTFKLNAMLCGPAGLVKSLIQKAEGISSKKQRLIYNGQQLEDHDLLSDHQIQSGATIHLVLKLDGDIGEFEPTPSLGREYLVAGASLAACFRRARSRGAPRRICRHAPPRDRGGAAGCALSLVAHRARRAGATGRARRRRRLQAAPRDERAARARGRPLR